MPSILIGLVALGRVEGVREGTVAAALCVGLASKQFSKPVAWFERRYLL